jgi:hypothetical protein
MLTVISSLFLKFTTATRLVGVVANVAVKRDCSGSTFSITNNTLNASPEYDPFFLLGNGNQSSAAATVSQYDNFDLKLRRKREIKRSFVSLVKLMVIM